MPSLIRDRAVSTDAMLAVFGDGALLDAALRFEAALAQAQADVGVIDRASAAAITVACAERPDIARLAEAAAHAGTLAIPLVEIIRHRIADPAIAKRVHMGATSQDLADTALMLQAKSGAALVVAETRRLADALALQAERHATTPMLGRTLLQGALPITFGLKLAGWLQGVAGALARFERETGAIQLQLGGATGSLAGLDGKAQAIVERLAQLLELPAAETPWHSRREGLAGLASSLAILTGAVGKIACDIALLSQNEVAEAFEPRIDGRGGSSAMAHKRNPTSCQVALSAAIRAPHLAATLTAVIPQQHERGLGGWQAEAPVLAELFQLTHGALTAMAPVVEGLEVDTVRMAANLAAADVGTDTGESETLAARALTAYQKDR